MPVPLQPWARTWRFFWQAFAPSRFSTLILAVVACAYFLKMAADLPRMPTLTPDSASYLTFVDFRPPGYFLFLTLHRTLAGGLDLLPHAQLGLLFLGVFALAFATAAIARNILAGFFVLLCSLKFAPWGAVEAVMSDTLFSALVAAGAAALLLYCIRPRLSLLAIAAGLFAFSATIRTIGEVLEIALLLSLGFLVLTRRLSLRGAAIALAPALAVFVAMSLFTYSQIGQFRVASTGGLSILGKALLIAKPLPPDNPQSRLNWIVAEVRPAQVSFARSQDPVLRALMARQYYESLRWDLVLPALERRWPAWTAASQGERGVLASALSREYVMAAPGAYLELVALDYASLWGVPHLVTAGERTDLQRRWKQMGEVALLREAEDRTPGDYRWVVGRPRPFIAVWAVRLLDALFIVASIGAGLLLLCARRARFAVAAPAILLLSAAVHGAYLATALNEAGLERYAAPFWPLILAMLALTPGFLRQSLRRA